MHVFGAAAEEFRTIIERVIRLGAFKGMTLHELRAAIGYVVEARNESVRLIEELERCFHVAKPFNRHRPAQSASAVDSFTANLETLMVAKWTAAEAAASPA